MKATKRSTKRKLGKSSLRNLADRLLQEYIRLAHKGEICLICGEREITVGHHFVYKSQSNATRYYLKNIIPLCRDCHCLIHTQPSLPTAKITLRMGQDWLNDLETVKRQGVKTNIFWYQDRVKEMQVLLTVLGEGTK